MRIGRLGGGLLVALGSLGLVASVGFLAQSLLRPGGGSLDSGCMVDGPFAPGFDSMGGGAYATGFINWLPLGRGCVWRSGDMTATAYPTGDASPFLLIPLLVLALGVIVLTRAARRVRSN
jgi:hypothetical protein